MPHPARVQHCPAAMAQLFAAGVQSFELVLNDCDSEPHVQQNFGRDNVRYCRSQHEDAGSVMLWVALDCTSFTYDNWKFIVVMLSRCLPCASFMYYDLITQLNSLLSATLRLPVICLCGFSARLCSRLLSMCFPTLRPTTIIAVSARHKMNSHAETTTVAR